MGRQLMKELQPLRGLRSFISCQPTSATRLGLQGAKAPSGPTAHSPQGGKPPYGPTALTPARLRILRAFGPPNARLRKNNTRKVRSGGRCAAAAPYYCAAQAVIAREAGYKSLSGTIIWGSSCTMRGKITHKLLSSHTK